MYDWYKSADDHQVKKELPWKKLSLIPIFIGGILACVVLVWWRMQASAPEPVKKAVETTQGAQGGPAAQPTPQPRPQLQPQQEGAQWSAQFIERVPGQPHSARFYDASVKARVFPKISGCLEIETETMYRCRCNTQQGTIITTIDVEQCRFYIANGWFDFSKPDEAEGRAVASAPAAASQPSLGGLAPEAAAAMPASVQAAVGGL